MPRLFALALLTLPGAATAADGWVALLNATQKPVSFRLDHGDAQGPAATLAPSEVRAVPAGRAPTIRYDAERYRLEPFGVYAFVPREGGVGFQGVELGGKMPDPADVGLAPAARPALRVPVRLACDQAEPRTREAWEKRARAVVAGANAVLEPQVGVTLDVVGVTTWPVAADLADLGAAVQDLARKVPAADSRLVIGFTPRPLGFDAAKPQYAALAAPLSEHLVVRDALPRGDAGRAEVLVQAVGRWLGAAGAPDPDTVMRPRLGDGLAGLTKFRVQFDPFNALAVRLVAGETRAGLRSLDQLSPSSKARLIVLYKSILAANPADARTVDALAALEPAALAAGAVLPALDDPRVDEPRKPAAPPGDPRRDAIRSVVAAIRLRAQVVRDLPPGERPRGDALTDDLVRAAADVAATAGGPHAAAALAVGLGIGLDDSPTLRDNLITRDLVRAVETDAEFEERGLALGRPTVRGRRDLCQHFAVSCALTDIIGVRGAELAGLTKEVRDLGGESGFSFVDLLANHAGVAFAEKLLADPAELGRVCTGFKTEERVPPIAGLRENLTGARFEADYGGLSDPRLKAALADVRDRVAKHLAR